MKIKIGKTMKSKSRSKRRTHGAALPWSFAGTSPGDIVVCSPGFPPQQGNAFGTGGNRENRGCSSSVLSVASCSICFCFPRKRNVVCPRTNEGFLARLVCYTFAVAPVWDVIVPPRCIVLDRTCVLAK